MHRQVVTINNVPEGYSVVDYRKPAYGEWYINPANDCAMVCRASSGSNASRVILNEIKPPTVMVELPRITVEWAAKRYGKCAGSAPHSDDGGRDSLHALGYACVVALGEV